MTDDNIDSEENSKTTALEKELKYYRDMFKNAPFGIFRSAIETGRFVNLNPAMERFMQELLGKLTTPLPIWKDF